MLLLLLPNQQPVSTPAPPTPPPPPPPPPIPAPPPTDGSQAQILQRLQFLMPIGWFSVGMVPIRDAILTGFANAFSFIFAIFAFIRLQTRIATMTGPFLDLAAYDFFGGALTRTAGQSDASFRNQIISFLFRERNTREAIVLVVEQLLGVPPVAIIEPQRATDCMCWDEPTQGGYDVAGVWGDTAMPLQCFVDIQIPNSLSIAPPFVGGYGTPNWGYGIGQGEYLGPPVLDPIAVADIMAAISSVLPVTGVAWVNIIGGAAPPGSPGGITMDDDETTFDMTDLTMDST